MKECCCCRCSNYEERYIPRKGDFFKITNHPDSNVYLCNSGPDNEKGVVECTCVRSKFPVMVGKTISFRTEAKETFLSARFEKVHGVVLNCKED